MVQIAIKTMISVYIKHKLIHLVNLRAKTEVECRFILLHVHNSMESQLYEVSVKTYDS